MANVIVAWLKNDSSQFEKHVPLKFMSQRNETLGSNNNFKIVVLEGYDYFSAEYLSDLRTLGNEVIDCSKLYKSQSDKFSTLNRFGDYEKKCFLRWLVLQKISPNEPMEILFLMKSRKNWKNPWENILLCSRGVQHLCQSIMPIGLTNIIIIC